MTNLKITSGLNRDSRCPDLSICMRGYSINICYWSLFLTFKSNLYREHHLTELQFIQFLFQYFRPSNYTLGLGQNRISIQVVDVTHTEPWVINTYTLYIHRASRTDSDGEIDLKQPHQICSLTQVGQETDIDHNIDVT